ncbi:MAG TPA: cupin domain-containing protein [Chloroflexota bacterium]|nr:cupin domain-containing protein [Chloroflexota bacterium]
MHIPLPGRAHAARLSFALAGTVLALAGCSWPAAPAGAPVTPKFLFDQQFSGSGGPYLVTIDRETYPPGFTSGWHTHPGPGSLCLLQGQVRIDVRGQPSVTLQPGQCWTEPPGVAHRPTNPAGTPAVCLFYLFAPADQPRLQPAPSS